MNTLCCRMLLVVLTVTQPAILAAQVAPEPPPAPAHEEAVWIGMGAAVAGSFLLDTSLRTDGNGSLSPLSEMLNPLGRPQLSVPALGAVYLAGRLAERPALSSAAVDIGAGLLAAGVANGAVKFLVGRQRPSDEGDGDADEFRPFNLADGWQSFPSGHTTVVFSLAAAISEEAHEPWVTVLTYGTASAVGWSRVYDDRHWSSDVVGGALIGAIIGGETVRWLHRRRAAGEVGPTLAVTPAGVAVVVPAF